MGTQNETLELIYAVKSLAQTVQSLHQDLRRLIEDEGRENFQQVERNLTATIDISRQLAILPILIGEKVEKSCRECANSGMVRIQQDLRDLRDSRRTVAPGAIPSEVQSEHEITGKIEVNKGGQVKVLFNSASATRAFTIVKWMIVTAAAGGGLTELIKWIKTLV
jgi:hypothetical protein